MTNYSIILFDMPLFDSYTNVIAFWGTREQDYRSLLQDKAGIQCGDVFIPKAKLVIAEQTQSDVIYEVTQKDAGSGFSSFKPRIPIADGLITRERDIFLCVRSADCVPILFHDPVQQVVCAVHCGREGVRNNAAGAAVRSFVNRFGSHPSDILAIIGPAICADHYRVDPTTYNQFVTSTQIPQNFPCLDLIHVVEMQLNESKLLKQHVERIPICTYENNDYFSYRRDGTKNRQIFVIGMKNE